MLRTVTKDGKVKYLPQFESAASQLWSLSLQVAGDPDLSPHSDSVRLELSATELLLFFAPEINMHIDFRL